MTKKIPLPPKEEFYKLYITDNLSKTQLTKHYKVGMSTIESWIRQFNIVKRATERIYQLPTKEDFFEQYHTKNLSAKELCEHYKVPEHIIRRWTQHFNFSKTSKEIGEIRAKAFYERHGVYNPSQLTQVQEKRKETMLATYGVDNIFKDTERIKKSYIDKLGVNNPSQLKEVKKKKEDTFLKHFGVKTSLQLPEVRQRQIEVTKEKYGENGVLGNEEIKSKIKKIVKDKYGVDNVMQMQENLNKMWVTKKKNNSFNTSKAENKVYELLLTKFSKEDVIRQYKSEEYPFNCDFYIKSRSLYIECNYYWTHGNWKGKIYGFFDKNNLEHLKLLKEWQNKKSEYYESAITNWTILDLHKLAVAKKNKLNYLVFWDKKLSDFLEWFNKQ